MSETDAAIVHRLISQMGEHAQESARRWVPYFRVLHQIRRSWEASGRTNRDFETQLDVTINNMEEEWHASIEDRAVPILAALSQGGLATLENDEIFVDFARFIAAQYMRTPVRIRRTVDALADRLPTFNVEAAWGLLRTIFADNIGAALYIHRKTMRITLLEAKGAVHHGRSADCEYPCDQVPPSELELYYPISPELALLLDLRSSSGVKERRPLPPHEVAAYNRLVSRASGEQIYARTEEALRSATASIGPAQP